MPATAVEIRHYPVVGSEWPQLVAAMARVGPARNGQVYAAYTDWAIEWHYGPDPSDASMAKLAIAATAIVTLPKWRAPRGASAALRERWRRYVGELEAHERGHVAHATDAVSVLVAELVPTLTRAPSPEESARVEASVRAVARQARAQDEALEAV